MLEQQVNDYEGIVNTLKRQKSESLKVSVTKIREERLKTDQRVGGHGGSNDYSMPGPGPVRRMQTGIFEIFGILMLAWHW